MKKNSVDAVEKKQTLRVWEAKMICSAMKSEEEPGKRREGKGKDCSAWSHGKGFAFHSKCNVMLLELGLF